MKIKMKHLLWVPVGVVVVFVAFIVFVVAMMSMEWNRLYNKMVTYAKANAVEIVHEVRILKEERQNKDDISVDYDKYPPHLRAYRKTG